LEGVAIVKKDGVKIIARILAAHGYRNNTPIEDIHAGRWPKNMKGEYADDSEVIVTTVDGGDKIPWTACSRIHDSEMEEINKSVVNNIYSILSLLEEFGTLPSSMRAPTTGMRQSMPLGIRGRERNCELGFLLRRLDNSLNGFIEVLVRNGNQIDELRRYEGHWTRNSSIWCRGRTEGR
jgi:hypothetical protein